MPIRAVISQGKRSGRFKFSWKETKMNTEFQTLAQQVLPTRYLDHKEYLLNVYQKVKESQKRYSYIQFTYELGLGKCNAMYLIIHGQRPLTLKSAKKISAAIGLQDTEREYFLKLVEIASMARHKDRDQAVESLIEIKSRSRVEELDEKQIQFHKAWYHSAVLELLGQKGARDDAEWIASQLIPSVLVSDVQQSLNLLLSLGYIKLDEHTKKLVPSEKVVSTGPEVTGAEVMSYHSQMIDLAKEAVNQVEPQDRNVSSVTISISRTRQEQIKSKIESLRQEILDLASENSDHEDVVQVNIQMFPLTKTKKGGQIVG